MKILKCNNARRGFTLVELCVVMSLMSIAALLIVSFTSAFQVKVVQNQARHDFLDDVSNVREAMQNWIANNDSGNSGVVVSSQFPQYIQSGSNVVIFTNEGFIFNCNGTSMQLSADSITSVTYEVYGNNRILKCTFTGKDALGKEFSQTMLFSLVSGNAQFVPVS